MIFEFFIDSHFLFVSSSHPHHLFLHAISAFLCGHRDGSRDMAIHWVHVLRNDLFCSSGFVAVVLFVLWLAVIYYVVGFSLQTVLNVVISVYSCPGSKHPHLLWSLCAASFRIDFSLIYSELFEQQLVIVCSMLSIFPAFMLGSHLDMFFFVYGASALNGWRCKSALDE